MARPARLSRPRPALLRIFCTVEATKGDFVSDPRRTPTAVLA
ncbi:MAG: hypothetical protein OXI96_07950 [Acidimicrobiaceae bacterium]|nr:hypothetical protein [Acidimicrobiaceae bacterium]